MLRLVCDENHETGFATDRVVVVAPEPTWTAFTPRLSFDERDTKACRYPRSVPACATISLRVMDLSCISFEWG